MSSSPLLVNQSKGYVETAKTEASFTVVEAPNMDLSTDTGSTDNNLGDSIPGYLFGSCLWAALPFYCFSCEEIIRTKYNPRCRIIKGLI
ncbi:MAG: hypothetical protein ACOC6N_00425 [archaeon]